MDSIPADITLKDTQGRFLMINKATSNERRRSEAEVLGKTAYQLYPHDVAREIFQQEREVLQSRRPVEREYRLVSNTFRLYAFLSDEQHDSRDPASYLQTLNARLVDLLPGGQFATMLYAIIDRARDRLDYAAAAAPHPLIIGPKPGQVGFGDGSGLPLGLYWAIRLYAYDCRASISSRNFLRARNSRVLTVADLIPRVVEISLMS